MTGRWVKRTRNHEHKLTMLRMVNLVKKSITDGMRFGGN